MARERLDLSVTRQCMMVYPIDISHAVSYPSGMNAETTIFKLNRSQAVRLPKDIAFPEGVKKVIVRKVGKSIMITPKESFWDEFFSRPACADFPDRAPQGDYEVRESFDL
jgi:antitoxin VapB